jgi:hypothetical protein
VQTKPRAAHAIAADCWAVPDLYDAAVIQIRPACPHTHRAVGGGSAEPHYRAAVMYACGGRGERPWLQWAHPVLPAFSRRRGPNLPALPDMPPTPHVGTALPNQAEGKPGR